MKHFYIILFFLTISSSVWGQVSMTVYEADGVTPFDFRDIMVGTELTVVVESASAASKCGGLFISGNDRLWGVLSARDRDPNITAPNCNFNNGAANGEPGDWTDSHLPAAGASATVYTYKDSMLWGFDTESDSTATTGNWYIFDYTAIDIDDPNAPTSVDIGLYDYDVNFFDPIQIATINQVVTRDFDGDKKVNYKDYSHFQTKWMATGCLDPNWCELADISRDGVVNIVDLDRFDDFWLDGM